MTSLYPQDPSQYLQILPVLLRLLGFMLLLPGFSHKAIPGKVKTTFAFALAMAVYPLVKMHIGPIPDSLGSLFMIALRETAIGLIMGFATYITFEAIHLASHFMGTQMGFGAAALMDPQNSGQVSLLVPLWGWLALMTFFLADMHHGMIKLFVMSFEATRNFHEGFSVGAPLMSLFVGLTTRLFVITVQMAAPITLLVLVCNVAIGVLSRLLPQMNVMLFSFPLTMVLGFLAMYLMAPELLAYLETILGEMGNDLMTVLRTL